MRRFSTRLFKLMVVQSIVLSLIFTHRAWAQSGAVPAWGDWQTWGDQGDGTYKNPILPGDFSDIDCIRVGSEYYAISSTFQYSPGMIILSSYDLVNWKIAGHAVKDISQIAPEMNWDKMNRYGRGIWAGSIRYHNHKFWIYFGTPDEGYFVTTAKKAEGPWEHVQQVLAQKGWDDCCPFWDDDGKGYFIGSNFSDGYKIHLFQLTAGGKGLLPGADKVIYQSKGSEANKLYKFNGMYYHLFSEVHADGRAVMMERSKTIEGPYTEIKQLSHAQRKANEPNQGGIVQTPAGEWYFLTHHGTGDWSGRNMSLLPVKWIGGWPILGAPGADTTGNMVWSAKMPGKVPGKSVSFSEDNFNKPLLNEAWEWNYQPRPDKWSLTERKGWLRLHAFQPLQAGNLLKAGNTITQRTLRTRQNDVVIRLDLHGMANGQHAGLTHFGSPAYSYLGVVCDGKTKNLEFRTKDGVITVAEIQGNLLWLKSSWGLDGKSSYLYSEDGKTYHAAGPAYQLMWGSYRGDRLGIYSFNDRADEGYIDVDFFKYTYAH